MAGRLVKGEQTPEDLKKLAEAKDRFFTQRKQVEEFLVALTPSMIDTLALQSDTLKVLVKAVGAEGVRDAVASQLEMASMQDTGQFKKMLNAYTQITEQAKKANEGIEKRCAEYGITSDEYLKILAGTPNANERQQKFADLLRSRMGRIKGLLPQTRKQNMDMREQQITGKAQWLNYFKRDIDQMRAEYDEAIKDTGDLLAVSINKNESLQKAFNATLLSEKIPEEKIGSFKEMKGSMPTEEELKKEWDAGWTAAKVKGVSESDYRKQFTEDANKKLGEKKGTWMDIVKKFMATSINAFTAL